ncbi:MAG: hypothetical protein LBG27_11245 [Spirochaetaceae bacterium]|jgi:hypothetical protein|nr:hypothetical protein [Spirochaetaceae bacterium]
MAKIKTNPARMNPVHGEKEKSGGKPAKTRLHPCQLIPSRLFAFFFVMEVWVFALYLVGAREGWPDSGLSFLVRHLATLGALTFVSALLGIVFDIAETLLFKRAFFLRFVVVYVVLGAAGLALGLLGGVFQTIAAGRLPGGL